MDERESAVCARARVCVCVCVCICERKNATGISSFRESQRKKEGKIIKEIYGNINRR